MAGIGTVVNAGAIVIAGILGYFFQRIIPLKVQETVLQEMGLGVIFIGVAGTLSNMLVLKHNQFTTTGTMALIVSLAIGTVIGELIDIDHWLNRFGHWLAQVFSGTSSSSKFSEGFVLSSLTVCIGGFAIVGALQDGLNHDPSLLFTKASIDFIIILLFAATYGLGCCFAAIGILVVEGGITLLAIFIKPLLTTPMIIGISLVGGTLITLIGINMLLNLKIKVANMLPAILVVTFYIHFFGLN
ncbi:DUF554 domain-containing protein [Convivina intestini]|uniref:DUF554 domain-containing protein n=1 Tax=Convivina intestini TaxID=1505726 RepID=UPI00200BC147|nr:DUF554 domain-containing protein [Convivina intestini]CAH1851696.1 putative membrane protein YdfK [Convivina intestini]